MGGGVGGITLLLALWAAECRGLRDQACARTYFNPKFISLAQAGPGPYQC